MLAVNNPKHFMAVMGLLTLAKKDIAVVAVVTIIELPALRRVQDRRWSNGQFLGSFVKDCLHVSIYTKMSSAPTPMIKKRATKFKRGKKLILKKTSLKTNPQTAAHKIANPPLLYCGI